MNKRIRMLKENNDDEYEHLIEKHIREYREVIQKETESTLFQFGIPEQDYNNSFEELSKKLSTAKLIANMELEVREKHESVLPLKSREEVKKIYCEQLKMEAESDLYLQQLLLSTDNTTEVLVLMIKMKDPSLHKSHVSAGKVSKHMIKNRKVQLNDNNQDQARGHHFHKPRFQSNRH